MITHHLQGQILRLLGGYEKARFSDIKPPDIENNAFQYHLKQLISSGLIAKNSDNSYGLTSLGKQEFINSHLDKNEYYQQAHAIFLCALKSDEKWLISRRKVQPEIGLTGFIHGEARFDEPLLETAKNRFLQKTGLECDFSVRGAGYLRISKDKNLSSFTHATLLFADQYTGLLITDSLTSSHSWATRTELESVPLIPSMPKMLNILDGSAGPFFDETYHL